MLERRSQPFELRAEGRRLSGTVLRFGDVAPSFKERFEAGAFRMEKVSLNLFHDRLRAISWLPGGGLEVREEDGELRMVAELPEIPAADVALRLVREKHVTGLSCEFRAERERMEDGIRVIEAALLGGIGLTTAPAYQSAHVEARQERRRVWL